MVGLEAGGVDPDETLQEQNQTSGWGRHVFQEGQEDKMHVIAQISNFLDVVRHALTTVAT